LVKPGSAKGSDMSDDDRIREFLKLRAEVQQNPRRIAGVIKKWIAEDQKPKPRKK
jgi:flagellar biosynthesis/type III secretory pathway M-ring protein FliF/YscJ